MRRLILTYNQSCNLSCEFCYVSFHHKKIIDKSIQIVEAGSRLGFDVITFGGGDSFTRKSFREACKLAKLKGLKVHIDTNALAIKQDDLELIDSTIDILGISIDGIGDSHDIMRKSKGLFNKIDLTLNQLQNYETFIKINTVLTRQNNTQLHNILGYIKQFKNVRIWSIYQFFPLDAALAKRDVYEINDDDFDQLTVDIINPSGSFIIEKFKYSQRVSGYIFSDELGNLYTNDITGSYKAIGSIFDTGIEVVLNNLKEKINPRTIHRY